MSDQKETPDEFLAMVDSLEGKHCWPPRAIEALRQALKGRDEARELVRAYVDPMDTHAEDEAVLKACGVMPDYCEDVK